MRPMPGSICTPISNTRNALRPVKRYFSSATAARNASTIAIPIATSTTITVFFTSTQKYGLCMARSKCPSVGCPGNHVGFRLL